MLSLVSSIDIDVKENVKKGENFIIKVSGNFVRPLTTENVQFYRRHMDTSMGKFELKKIEGDYYFFLEIPLEKEADNYSVVLEGIEYWEGNKIVEKDVGKNFTILNETVPFSILPPLIVTNNSYNVTIQNLLPTRIEINLEKTIKTIEEIESSNETVESEGFLDILFGLFSKSESINETNTTNVTIETVVTESTSSKKITLKSGEKITIEYPALEKKGFEKLELYYENEGYAVLVYSLEDHPKIVVNETEELNLTNESLMNETCSSLNLTICNETKICVGNVTYLMNETCCKGECVVKESVNTTAQNCSSIGGKSCKVNEEKCEGNITYTKTEACCIGECVSTKKSNTGKIVGWTIIIIILLFLTWFLKRKYLRAGPGKVNLLEVAKGK